MDEEKAEILQEVFTSVFVEEGNGDLPDFPTFHQGKVVDDADFSARDVKLELENLKTGLTMRTTDGKIR